ncbi:hypothetical protein WJX74_009644 [Apatococcus lobatus]|uniref:ATP-dependent DNA helicase n=1 Tax=Apatococcus lobatus TaxID=904363 RepID=A0AAW1RM47_9CHLO
MRHVSDPEYSSFLDVCRDSTPAQSVVDAVLQERSISFDAATTTASETKPILCSHRRDAELCNQIVMQRLFPASIVEVPLTGTASTDPRLAEWCKERHFHELPCVAVGCKVMLNENLDIEKGAVNGATATVLSLHSHRNELHKILVRFDHNGQEYAITRTRFKTYVLDRQRFFKRAFPLTLAYAFTVHKAQGATLPGGAILYIREAFTPGLTYVALSRVTNRSNLHIIGTLSAADIVPVDCAWFQDNVIH